MREIKFRAWDDRQMRFPNMVDIRSAPRFFTCYTTDEKEPSWFDTDRLMQFTSLKDKNGKEIYEDDIVKYKNELFVIRWIINGAMFEASPTDRKGRQGLLSPSYYDRSEIIGNIYENPELLNSDKNDEPSVATEVK